MLLPSPSFNSFLEATNTSVSQRVAFFSSPQSSPYFSHFVIISDELKRASNLASLTSASSCINSGDNMSLMELLLRLKMYTKFVSGNDH